jgi:hypothetical protein
MRIILKFIYFVLTTAPFLSSCYAEDNPSNNADFRDAEYHQWFENWYCVGIDNLSNLVIQHNNSKTLVTNNYFIEETGSFMAESLQVVKFNFSISNRESDSVLFNIQIIGKIGGDNGNAVLSLSGEPLFDMVSSASNESVEIDSYISKGLINKIDTICLAHYFE